MQYVGSTSSSLTPPYGALMIASGQIGGLAASSGGAESA